MIIKDSCLDPYILVYDLKGWQVTEAESKKHYELVEDLQKGIQNIIHRKLATDQSIVSITDFIRKDRELRKQIQKVFEIAQSEETKENVETLEQSSIAITE